VISHAAERTIKRHGYSLIEVLVVLSLGAVLTGIIVAAMASLLRYDRHITQHVEQRTELQRLTATIRADLHQATDFQWNAAEQTFQLELPEQPIRYQVIEGRWMRLAGEASNPTRRTAYALSESFRCHCEPAIASQGARVVIEFNDKGNQERPSLRREIIATLGRVAAKRKN